MIIVYWILVSKHFLSIREKKKLFTFKGRAFFSKTNFGWEITDLSGKEKIFFLITIL